MEEAFGERPWAAAVAVASSSGLTTRPPSPVRPTSALSPVQPTSASPVSSISGEVGRSQEARPKARPSGRLSNRTILQRLLKEKEETRRRKEEMHRVRVQLHEERVRMHVSNMNERERRHAERMRIHQATQESLNQILATRKQS